MSDLRLQLRPNLRTQKNTPIEKYIFKHNELNNN